MLITISSLESCDKLLGISSRAIAGLLAPWLSDNCIISIISGLYGCIDYEVEHRFFFGSNICISAHLLYKNHAWI